MIQELNETTVKDFIKDGKVIVKAWMDDCSFCDDFKPTFEAAEARHPGVKFGSINIPKSGSSEFRRNYMKSKPGESAGAPAIFFFEGGNLVRKNHGNIPAEVLDNFILGREMPPSQEEIKRKRLYDLFAQKGAVVHDLEKLQAALVKINADIAAMENSQ